MYCDLLQLPIRNLIQLLNLLFMFLFTSKSVGQVCKLRSAQGPRHRTETAKYLLIMIPVCHHNPNAVLPGLKSAILPNCWSAPLISELDRRSDDIS